MENNHNILIANLVEREKELNCLYSIEKLLIKDNEALEDIIQELIQAIPPGWQYPHLCKCRLRYEDIIFKSEGFTEKAFAISSKIVVDENICGKIEIIYTKNNKPTKNIHFLPEEQILLNTIAGTFGRTIFRRKLKSTLDYIQRSKDNNEAPYNDKMILGSHSDQHWQWRMEIVNKIAEQIDLERFGLNGLYLIGSTKNATAGPGSDIDILAHSSGNDKKNDRFKHFMEGWGYALSEINQIKTGYSKNGNLIDLHIITDEDIKNKSSYAILINNIDNRALPIKVKP